MYVAPDTNLIFIKNCPLASNLEHTILFESAGAQQAYFAGLSSQTVDKYSFQRATIGVVRVGIPWNDCIGFNYMAFQNHAHGDKWFYAFITNYEYINEGCTAVFFQIDVLQTYMFDWTIGSCFVERETTETDEPGEYIMPEGLDTGDYVPYSFYPWRATPKLVAASTSDMTSSSFEDISSPINIYSNQCCEYRLFTTATFSSMANVLNAMAQAGKISGIKYLYSLPAQCLITGGQDNVQTINSAIIAPDSPKNISRPTAIGTYEPKNKKLLTYPYTFIGVLSTLGNIAQYRFEWFLDPDNITFNVEIALTPQSSILISPTNYHNEANNRRAGCVLPPLPLAGFNYDVYSNWFALNKNRINNEKTWESVNTVRSLVGISGQFANSVYGISSKENQAIQSGAMTASEAMSVSSAGLAAAAIGTMLQVAGAGLSLQEKISAREAAFRDMEMIPAQAAQLSQASDVQLANNEYGWDVQVLSLQPEYLKAIDDYFSRFGYKIMQTKTPTLNNRPVWDYIKTLDTDIGGNVPTIALTEIRSAFERGITFWHNAATFGDYSQNNSV